MRRWDFRPGQPRRRRGGKKGDPQEPPDHALGRSRGGYGTKVHLVSDGGGVPLGAWVSPGQEHESTHFARAMAEVTLPIALGAPELNPHGLAGDKAYSSPALRRWLEARHIRPVIPLRADEIRSRGEDPSFDREAYRGRNVIERLVGWLKECRRVATRFEKLVLDAGSFLVSEHVQNLARIGLNAAAPVTVDPGVPRERVWGLPWRSNEAFPGLAYCPGGRSLYWGGWAPKLTDADLAQWPAELKTYLGKNCNSVERGIGVDPSTDYIHGPLQKELKKAFDTARPGVPSVDKIEDAPLSVYRRLVPSGPWTWEFARAAGAEFGD